MRLRQAVASTTGLGVALFIFSAGFPPFDDATEVDLTLHMLQHVLIIFAGIMVAYPLLGRRMLKDGASGPGPALALAGASGLIVFWHFPYPWDTAVLNPVVHVVEHFSFLVVGVLVGTLILLLSDSLKIGALLAAFFGHMGFAVALISPWNEQVYSIYTLADQNTLGWVLLLTGPSLLVGVAYLVVRNPEWLGTMGNVPTAAKRRRTFVDGVKVPRWVTPVLTAILVISMAGYYGYAAYALAGSNPVTSGGPVVYIVETPVTWQYTPQNLTVVLGVNSSVQWVSHSLSFDTVTDRGGAFTSGPIAPGSSFRFDFTSPGVYSYYCQYHPWMSGTITVRASA